MPEDWITTVAAAELSGYHVNHIRRLIRLQEIEARKFGPVWQISRRSLSRYLEKAKESGDGRWGAKP
jgi:excisionase family DNA binding protein